MSKVLSQEEIDLILGQARDPGKAAKPTKQVEPWNPRGSGELHNEHTRAITTLHEGCARNMGHSLGAYLRVPFEVSLLSVEQLLFEEFFHSIQETTYLQALHLQPQDAIAVLQIDNSIVFPIIDVLLGGIGTKSEIAREVSEIEEQIMDGVTRLIVRELASGWAPLGFDITPGQRFSAVQIQRYLPPQEKALGLSFEITLNDNKGMMNLVFPTSLSSAMRRKLSEPLEYRKPKACALSSARMRDHVWACRFDVSLSMPNIRLRVKDLIAAQPGSVLDLRVPESSPASLVLDGRQVFDARAVRIGTQRAAQLHSDPRQLPPARKVQ